MEIKDFCTGLQHIGIPTNDIEQSIAFYNRLGFELIMRTQNGDEKVAFLQMHNVVIETYENHAATLQAGAIDHIAIDVKNIEALFEIIKTEGFELVDEGINSLPFWERGIKYFIILGPNREKIEFCERL